MNASKHLVFWSIAVRNLRRFPGRALAIAGPLFVAMSVASVMTFIKDGLLHDALARAE
ncbi:MAG: hypothetical protein HY814_08955, partial [Candidatus Riflebacteria bacterium]|nr:hypothetical protein [Candidatus Riflebacteria bacterium]